MCGSALLTVGSRGIRDFIDSPFERSFSRSNRIRLAEPVRIPIFFMVADVHRLREFSLSESVATNMSPRLAAS